MTQKYWTIGGIPSSPPSTSSTPTMTPSTPMNPLSSPARRAFMLTMPTANASARPAAAAT